MILTIETILSPVFTQLHIDRSEPEIRKMFDNGDLDYDFMQVRTEQGKPVRVFCLGDQVGKVLDVSYEVTSERIYSIKHDYTSMFDDIELALRGEADGTEALDKLMKLKTIFYTLNKE